MFLTLIVKSKIDTDKSMEITKQQGILIRGVAILMIVLYHIQYDLFGGTFLQS